MITSSKPNVLFILADDQRFDTIATQGNPQIKTPHLDQLIKRGTRFTHAHIPGGTSAAVCMPSRAMIHTGRELFEIDGVGESIPESHTLLGGAFRKAGYQTFGTGKWHNGAEAYARAFSDGGEIFFGGMDDHWNVPACNFDRSGEYNHKTKFCPTPSSSNREKTRLCDHLSPGVHSTDLFTDATLEFLDRKNTEKPFFAYVSLMAPHDPRVMPEKYLRLYDHVKIELPENFLHQHPFDTGALDIRDELLAKLPREADDVKQHIKEYYAMITHLDEAIGRLVEHLKASGELENTIIVFSGDNGLAVGQHGLMGKQNLYDHSVRVPLIYAGPGIPENKETAALCFLSDIFPTLSGLCEIDTPSSVTGKNFTSTITGIGKAEKPRDALYLIYANTLRGVTDGRYKLIEYASGQTQLFDLQNDRIEMKNLAAEPAAQLILKRMRQQLKTMHLESNERHHGYNLDFWNARSELLN